MLSVQADLLSSITGLWRAGERVRHRPASWCADAEGSTAGTAAGGLAAGRVCVRNRCCALPSRLCFSSTCLTPSFLRCKRTEDTVMSSLAGWLLLRCAISSLDALSQNLNGSLTVGKYSMHLHTGVYKYKRVLKCFEAQLLKTRGTVSRRLQHCLI